MSKNVKKYPSSSPSITWTKQRLIDYSIEIGISIPQNSTKSMLLEIINNIDFDIDLDHPMFDPILNKLTKSQLLDICAMHNIQCHGNQSDHELLNLLYINGIYDNKKELTKETKYYNSLSTNELLEQCKNMEINCNSQTRQDIINLLLYRKIINPNIKTIKLPITGDEVVISDII